MKKLLRILSISFGVILLLLILIPVLFKSKIEALVKEKVNESVYATVDWSRFSLSLFRGFPDLSINLHQLTVVGIEDFQGDTLLGLKRFELRVNPFSAIRKDLQVKSILLDNPLINGIVLDDGSANWDISTSGPPEDEMEPGEEDGGSSLNVSLEKVSIKNGRIHYHDAEMGARAAMEDFNMALSGDFSTEETELELKVKVSGIDAFYDGIRYVKHGEFRLDLLAAANLVENRYTILENEIELNKLVLGTEGEVLLLEDGGMDLDIRFFSKQTSFQTLLSLVPAIYLNDFESIEASGSLILEGAIKGRMGDSLMPDARLSLQVVDGYFSYPDLPKDVSDVQIELAADYNGKNMDLTTVDLEKFHLSLGGNPIDAKFHVDHPISDMHVTGALEGLIDFGSLNDLLPMENMDLSGRMTANLKLDTKMSYIEEENFEEVNLDGSILVEGVSVLIPEIPVPIELRSLEMNFNPRYVDLSGADLQMGSSDLHMEGALSNFIPFVFAGETVSGALKISSSLLDAGELMTESAEEAKEDSVQLIAESAPDSLYQAPEANIPVNIDFILELDVKKLIKDEILLENIVGEVRVKNGIAYLNGLNLDLIGGHAVATGSVDTRDEFARADFSLDMQEVDIPRAYSTFVTVERLAPMARYCKGDANVNLDFSSLLDASFSPLYESVNARGKISTSGLQIYNMRSFVRLSELLKSEKFRDMTPDDMNIKFQVEEGKVIVDPFDVSFEDSKITVSGLHGIDMSLDYLLDMNIAKADLGSGAVDLMDGISAMASSAGFKIPESDFVKIKVRISGTFEEPLITTDLGANLNAGKAEVKKIVEERVAEEVEKVEEVIREEAEEERAQIMEDARKAGEQLVREAEKQGENLVKEAGSNPLKKMAARAAADELVRQANKQAENLLREAQTQADEIMAQARTEASRL